MVLRWWGSSTRKFGFINGVDNVDVRNVSNDGLKSVNKSVDISTKQVSPANLSL